MVCLASSILKSLIYDIISTTSLRETDEFRKDSYLDVKSDASK